MEMLDSYYFGLHTSGKYIYSVVLGKVVREEAQEAVKTIYNAGIDQGTSKVHHPVFMCFYRGIWKSDRAALRNGPNVAFPCQLTGRDNMSIHRVRADLDLAPTCCRHTHDAQLGIKLASHTFAQCPLSRNLSTSRACLSELH